MGEVIGILLAIALLAKFLGWSLNVFAAPFTGNFGPCSHCRKRMKTGATVCRFCGRDRRPSSS